MISRKKAARRTFGIENLEGRNAPSGFAHAHVHALVAAAHKDLPTRTPEVQKLETRIPEKAETHTPSATETPDPAGTTTTDPTSPDTGKS